MFRLIIALLVPAASFGKVTIGGGVNERASPSIVRILRVSGTGVVTATNPQGDKLEFRLHGIEPFKPFTDEAGRLETIASYLSRGRLATLVPRESARGGLPTAQFILADGTDLGLQMLRAGCAKPEVRPSTPVEYLRASRPDWANGVETRVATRTSR